MSTKYLILSQIEVLLAFASTVNVIQENESTQHFKSFRSSVWSYSFQYYGSILYLHCLFFFATERNIFESEKLIQSFQLLDQIPSHRKNVSMNPNKKKYILVPIN
jgi:glycopeptide antibiotics resistance protein